MEMLSPDESSAGPRTVGARALRMLLSQLEPVLALAPMQDVTDLPFWG